MIKKDRRCSGQGLNQLAMSKSENNDINYERCDRTAVWRIKYLWYDPVLGQDCQVVSRLTGDESGAHVPRTNKSGEVPSVRHNGPPPIVVCVV
jgi:hypothetical protein